MSAVVVPPDLVLVSKDLLSRHGFHDGAPPPELCRYWRSTGLHYHRHDLWSEWGADIALRPASVVVPHAQVARACGLSDRAHRADRGDPRSGATAS